MTTVDLSELREQLLAALCRAVGEDPAEVNLDGVDKLFAKVLPIVIDHIGEQSRAYAKAAIRWAAGDVPMPYDVRMDLQARADWVGAGHQFE